jgi:hypothetical protein
VDAATGSVTVTRAFDNTKAASHASGARVFAPVYVGSNGQWVGVPDRSSAALRYAMRIESEDVARLLANDIAGFMANGASGAWLDICSPSFFNLANAFGEEVTPWDFATNSKYDRQSRKEAQDLKLARIQDFVHQATGKWPELTANNLGGGYFEKDGGGMDFLRSTKDKPRPIRGAVIEAAFSFNAKKKFAPLPTWKANLATLIHGAQNGLAVWPWLKSYPDTLRPLTREADAMALYDYASVLLGWEFGGGSAIVTEAVADDGKGGTAIYLPRFWFYDLGKPVDRVGYDEVEKLRVPGHAAFQRRWTGGIVLVNPTEKSDQSIELESGYSDPETGEAIRQIQLGPHEARILLRSSGH